MSDVTRILNQVEEGDPAAADQLLPLVYDELRRLAAARLAQEPDGQTLQPTALVHEAWLKLAGSRQEWSGRGHFFSAAAEAMRRILIDRARKRNRQRHGAGRHRVDLDAVELAATTDDGTLLELNEALEALAGESPETATGRLTLTPAGRRPRPHVFVQPDDRFSSMRAPHCPMTLLILRGISSESVGCLW